MMKWKEMIKSEWMKWVLIAVIALALLVILAIFIENKAYAGGRTLAWTKSELYQDSEGNWIGADGYNIYFSFVADPPIDPSNPATYHPNVITVGDVDSHMMIFCNKDVWVGMTGFNVHGESDLSNVITEHFAPCLPQPPLILEMLFMQAMDTMNVLSLGYINIQFTEEEVDAIIKCLSGETMPAGVCENYNERIKKIFHDVRDGNVVILSLEAPPDISEGGEGE